MFIIWMSRSKSVSQTLLDLNDERSKKITRLQYTAREWELVDKEKSQFNMPYVRNEDAFALLNIRGPTTFLALFLIFIGDDLLRAVWDHGLDEHGWCYVQG